MKNSVLLSFLASIFVIGACAKTNVEPLVLVSVSAETFTHEGGIGCAEFNLKDISVVSSQPDWLKVQTFESTVLFNVYSNSTYEPRTGSITVSAMGAGSVVLNITQQQFSGLYVTTETLNFSDQSLHQSLVVVSSSSFTVDLTENPNNVFDCTVNENGLVVFSVTRGQGMESYSGRAVITPTGEGNPITISLYMPKKSVYDYLLGTWEVANTTHESNNRYPMTFEVKSSQDTYNVYVDAPGIKAFPFTAQFINGKVKVSSGQEMGSDGSTYYNLHFNGPKSGQGNYILNGAGQVAVEAVPVFDEDAGTITLSFVDNGQGKEYQARDWAFFCGSRYWDFASNVAFYRNLVLRKSYAE